MQDTNSYLLDGLRATLTTLEVLLHDCTQERAQPLRSRDGGWSAVEIVCHLRDHEERALERTRLMRDQTDPLIAGYDQEQWARERNYAASDLREAFQVFVRWGKQHIEELSALTPIDWERTGQHEERGRITIGGQTFRLVCHDAIHAAQLARQLRQTSTSA